MSLSAITAQSFGVNESQLNFGLEDLTSFALLIPLGSIYTNDRSGFNDLTKVTANTGANLVATNPITQMLVLIAFAFCIIRVLAHPLVTSRPAIDLIFSLAVWGIFLTVWILTSQTKTALTTLRAAASSTPDQQKIVDLALNQINIEQNWAILGFFISTAYTVYGLVYTLWPFLKKTQAALA